MIRFIQPLRDPFEGQTFWHPTLMWVTIEHVHPSGAATVSDGHGRLWAVEHRALFLPSGERLDLLCRS